MKELRPADLSRARDDLASMAARLRALDEEHRSMSFQAKAPEAAVVCTVDGEGTVTGLLIGKSQLHDAHVAALETGILDAVRGARAAAAAFTGPRLEQLWADMREHAEG